LLLFPDFQADERLYQSLSRAVRQVTEKGKKGYQSGKVLIQTFRPESAFFQKAGTLGSEDFFKQTLNEREDLFYPPFSRLISLACQGKTEKEVAKKITALSQKLRELIPKNFRLHEPTPARFLKKQALFQSTLLLRFPHQESLTEAVRQLLKENSKDIIVDVDPLSIN
jgi:primosomal protein N' (replication factor Y)